jgi:5-methylcytosine-specific restriction endonuclease McrA
MNIFDEEVTIDTDLVALNRKKRSLRMTMAREKGTHTKEEWEALKQEFKEICVRCGKKCIQVKDHILSVYLGGSDGIDNIQPLCWDCNVKKRSEEFNWKEYRRKHGFSKITFGGQIQ